MPKSHQVDSLLFLFPDDWHVGKYDNSQFYKARMQKIKAGIKAVDLLAVSPEGVAYFVEVKDYRSGRIHTNPIDIGDVFIEKVLFTLAALLPMKLHAYHDHEKDLAGRVLAANRIRLMLHLEQIRTPSKLFPRPIDRANVQQKIKQCLKAIDPRPRVLEMGISMQVPWTISSIDL